jgi:hypothetical protein
LSLEYELASKRKVVPYLSIYLIAKLGKFWRTIRVVFIIYKLDSVWKNKKIEVVGRVDEQFGLILFQTRAAVQNPTEAHPSATQNMGNRHAPWLCRSGSTLTSCSRRAGPQHPLSLLHL